VAAAYQSAGVDFALSVEQQFSRSHIAAVRRHVQRRQVVLSPTHTTTTTTLYARCIRTPAKGHSVAETGHGHKSNTNPLSLPLETKTEKYV